MLNQLKTWRILVQSVSNISEDDDDVKYEYDDLCTPERVVNFILLGLYLITLFYVTHQFIKKQRAQEALKESKWLLDKNKSINILMIVALIARIVYFSDAFSHYILDGNDHLIFLPIYLNMSSIVFFCVSQFCILICRVWLLYVDRALDSNINLRLKEILKYSTYINPFLAAVMIGLGLLKQVPVILAMQIVISVSLALMVSISGLKFRSSLEKYITGPILLRVKLNVLVICFCYISRFVYDLVKVASQSWFANMRKTEANDHPDRYYYSMFLFTLILFVEYLPILMFTLNLNFVFSSSLSYTPTSGKYPVSSATVLGEGRAEEPQVFRSVLRLPSTGGVKVSLLTFDHE